MSLLTKAQYLFLKDFKEKGERNSKEDPNLKFFNRQKINVEEMSSLLEKHPDIRFSEPFSNKENSNDSLSGQPLIDYIDIYLKESGLDGCVEYFSPRHYALTQKAVSRMEEYEREEQKCYLETDANKKSKIANVISIIALLISIVLATFEIIFHCIKG